MVREKEVPIRLLAQAHNAAEFNVYSTLFHEMYEGRRRTVDGGVRAHDEKFTSVSSLKKSNSAK